MYNIMYTTKANNMPYSAWITGPVFVPTFAELEFPLVPSIYLTYVKVIITFTYVCLQY